MEVSLDEASLSLRLPLVRRLAIWALGKACCSTALRSLSAFATQLAEQTGFSVATVTRLRGCNQILYTLLALLSPRVALSSGGLERSLCLLLALQGLASLLPALATRALLQPAFVVSSLLLGLKGAFDAGLSSFVSAAAPPARRGALTGIVEASWGASSLVGLPLAGALLAASPKAFFACCGVAQLLPAIALALAKPLPTPYARPAASGCADAAPPSSERSRDEGSSWAQLLTSPPVLRLLIATSLSTAALDAASIGFGLWLSSPAGRALSAGRVAAATLALGAADVSGELGATLRLSRAPRGAAAALRASLLAAALALALLPPACALRGPPGLGIGIALHFVVFTFAEAVVVFQITLSQALDDASRGKAESALVASLGLGHVAASFISEPLYASAGVSGYALFAAAVCFAVAAADAAAARGRPPPPRAQQGEGGEEGGGGGGDDEARELLPQR